MSLAPTTPIIGITMGDAAGVGPEIIVDAWKRIVEEIPCRPIVFGHPEILRRAAALRQTDVVVVECSPHPNPLPEGEGNRKNLPEKEGNKIPCIVCGDESVLRVQPGTVDAAAGEAAFQAIAAAIDAALKKEIDAVVTTPIHKGALNLAGHHYPGHTELLAERCGVDDFAMMLYLPPGQDAPHPIPLPKGEGTDGLAVVHVTLHTAMRTIFDLIDIESVLAKIRLADGFMARICNRRPRIGVCSLNPHAGEDGLFGSEEIDVIRPAVESAQAEGMNVTGPFPADTIMIDAQSGRYDAVVAMFHDQGHIALKLLGMHRAVNITLGLPIIRTSVAHGTAFDKAWRGTAEVGSLIGAVRVAAKLSKTRA